MNLLSVIFVALVVLLPVQVYANPIDCYGDDAVWHVIENDPNNR